MENDIKKISVTKEQIDEICQRLGSEISRDYAGRTPLIIGLLKGCQPFMSDLVRNITIPCNLEYMKVSSYRGTESTGIVTVKGEMPNVKDREIIIIDDILDSGRTLDSIRQLLFNNKAKSVELCVLLDKPEGRVVDIQAKYIGSLVPNEFVVGYGLDYNEFYRNLPYIGVLKEEIYTKEEN